MPDINMQVFEEVKRNQLVTEVDIQTQVALDDYQVRLSDIANPTQSQDNVVIDMHGEFLQHWNESLDFDTWIKMSMEVAGKRILMLRGNSNVSSKSSIDNVMIFGDGFDTDKSKWTGDTANLTISGSTGLFNAGGTTSKYIYSTSSFTLPYIIESSMKRPANATNRVTGFGLIITNEADMAKLYYDWGINNQARFEKNNGGRQSITTNISVNVAQKNKMVGESSSSIRWYFDNVEGLNSPYTNSTHIITAAAPIAYEVRGTVDYELYWVFARKYVATEPVYSLSIPKNIITALKSLGRAG